MSKITVGLGQIASSAVQAENLAQILATVEAAKAAEVKILVFPEAAQISFAADVQKVAEPLDGPFANAIRQVAEKMIIVIGMFSPSLDGRTHNSLLITGAGVDAVYHKVHLFDAFGVRESDKIAPGSNYVVVDTPYGKLGVATCFDLRFAEQFTALGRKGAEIIAVAASWHNGPDKAEQWDLLIRARATDAQAWLLACGQAWRNNNPDQLPLGIGRSAIVGPLGTVHAQLTGAPDLLISQIDLKAVKDARTAVPII